MLHVSYEASGSHAAIMLPVLWNCHPWSLPVLVTWAGGGKSWQDAFSGVGRSLEHFVELLGPGFISGAMLK